MRLASGGGVRPTRCSALRRSASVTTVSASRQPSAIQTPVPGSARPPTWSRTHAAVAVAQSLGEFLNVGATVRVVHGQAVHALFFRGGPDDVLDEIGSFQTTGTTTVDVDAGAMLRFEPLRVGLAVRNLREPTFEALGGGPGMTLEREVRIGGAFFPGRGVTVSADADLTRTTLHGDTWRGIAAGVEGKVAPRVVLRGGLGGSTTGDARTSASVGAQRGDDLPAARRRLPSSRRL